MNKAKPATSKRGRPQSERLTPEDADFIQQQIKTIYPKFVQFCEDAAGETEKLESLGYGAAKDAASIERTFKYAFKGDRPLPEYCWLILEELLSIVPEDLPSKKGSSTGPKTKPLAKLLKDEPASSLRSHILSVMRGDSAGYELRDFVFPDVIRVMAEKLVAAPLNDFIAFFLEFYDIKQQIKHGVSRFISDSASLRQELAKKVARTKYLDIVDWFHSYSRYCSPELAGDVEKEFLDYTSEPSFKEEYEWRDLHHVCTLIGYFKAYECVSAVSFLKSMCFQDNAKRIRDSLDTKLGLEEVAKLASVIGKKQFETSLVAAVGKKDASQMLKQLKR